MDFIVILIYKQFHKSSINKNLSQAKLEQHFSKIFTADFEQFLKFFLQRLRQLDNNNSYIAVFEMHGKKVCSKLDLDVDVACHI